jgi:hypothetical protein
MAGARGGSARDIGIVAPKVMTGYDILLRGGDKDYEEKAA